MGYYCHHNINQYKKSIIQELLKNPSLHNTYLKYKKHLNKVIKSAKQTYYSTKFSEIKPGDARQFWKLKNNILNRKSKQNFTLTDDFANDTDKKSMLNRINRHFAKVGSIIHNSIDSNTSIPKSDKTPLNSFVLDFTTDLEVINQINNLKVKKSTGLLKSTTFRRAATETEGCAQNKAFAQSQECS